MILILSAIIYGGESMSNKNSTILLKNLEHTRVVYYNGYCIEYRNLEELSEKLTALKLKSPICIDDS
jgi:hypothetical protein